MAFDIFISFKNLNEKGVPTRDAELANEVYDFLTRKSLSVFISTVTLESLGASDYKKAIDEALDGASIVVAVGTSTENLNSQWVRYEWDGFYGDILSGVKPRGKVFTYIEGLRPAQLPRALRQTQTFIHSSEALGQLHGFIVQALRQEQPTETRATPLPLEAVPRPELSVTAAPLMRQRVFISHVAEDAQYAEALSAVIVQAGFEVFSAKGLDAGEEWESTVMREISNCAYFVAIISRNTERKSEGFFRKEWYLASDRSLRMNRPFILPVVVGNLKSPEFIPDDFRRIQMTFMTGLTVPHDIVRFFHRAAKEVELP